MGRRSRRRRLAHARAGALAARGAEPARRDLREGRGRGRLAEGAGVRPHCGPEETRPSEQGRSPKAAAHHAADHARLGQYMRCNAVRAWADSWAPAGLFGGIPGQGTDTASAPIALAMTKAIVKNEPMLGASLPRLRTRPASTTSTRRSPSACWRRMGS